MLKLKLSALFCGGLILNICAQLPIPPVVIPNPWNTNGNIADSNNFIGTKNEHPLVFRTNDIEQMRIAPDGNILVKNDLILEKLVDSTFILLDDVLMIDSTGTVQRAGSTLKELVYSENSGVPSCKDANGGYTTPGMSVWLNGPGKLYTSRQCVPNALVGIGQNNPEAKLHIKMSEVAFPDTKGIIVEDASGDKLMQLNSDGLLYAREMKVNLDAEWPDYVFDENYSLMPLEDVKEYIEQNNHLPNVPNACEMEQKGINVADNNIMLMEKVEELTLYILQLQEQMLEQQKEIEVMN